MYGIYANIWGILMNVTIYSIHVSYGYMCMDIYIYNKYITTITYIYIYI